MASVRAAAAFPGRLAARWLRRWGKVYERSERWNGSARFYSLAVRCDPQHSESWLGLGRVQEARAEWEGAAKAYESAAVAMADSADRTSCLFRLGYLYELLGRCLQAGDTYLRALETTGDTKFGARFDEIERLLEEPLPREDGKFGFRARHLEAEAELGEVLSGDFVSPRALILHASLGTRLSKWEESEQRWTRLLSCFPGYELIGATALAQTRRRLGDLEGAARVLQDVPSAIASEPQVVSEREQIEAERVAVRGAYLLEQYIEEGTAANGSAASGLLSEALSAQGVADAQIPVVARIIERSCRTLLVGSNSEDSADVPGPTDLEQRTEAGPSGDSPAVILTAGFGWSGSSAVKDYLLECPSVGEPYPHPELSCLARRYDNVPLIDVLKEVRAEAGEWRPAMCRFLLTSILGLWFPNAIGPKRGRLRRMSAYGHLASDNHRVQSLVAACHRLLDRLPGAAATSSDVQEDVMAAVRGFLDDLVRASGLACRHFVLDNVVRARSASLVDLFSDAHVIGVYRDPRDQFVARMYERVSPDARQGSLSVETFINQAKGMFRRFEQAGRHPSYGDRVIKVQFEEFVRDANVRSELCDRLEVEPSTGSSLGKVFDPVASARNIGIFRSYGHTEDIRKIEVELANYLVDV